MVNDKRTRGDQAEELAWEYLKKQGLKLETRNYLTRMGEIDIIAWDKKTLVFAEVRLRNPSKFGTGLESITRSKQKKITATAEHFLQKRFKSSPPGCRFDVISIDGDLSQNEINWVQNAFTG